MALKLMLENFDGVDEAIQKLYIEKDGKFYLDVDGHDKNENKIPLGRLNQEIDKRKAAETELATIAESLKADIPEDLQDLVPDLPPGKLITWLRSASRLFDPKLPIDTKKPGGKEPTDFSNLPPQKIMSMGYKTK